MFRLFFAAALAVVVLNPAALFGIEDNNPIEKGFLIASGLALILTRQLRVTNIFLLGVLALITVWCASLTEFEAFSWDRYGRGLTSLLAPFLFLCAVPTLADRRAALAGLSLLPVVSVAIGAIYAAIGLSPMWSFDESGIFRLQGSLSNPAYLGAAAFVGSYAALQYSTLWTRAFLILAATNVLICLLTASRMAAFLAVVLSCLVFFSEFRSRFSLLAIGTLASLLAGLAFVTLVGGEVIARLTSETLSGRDLLWGQIRTYIDAYPLVGIGLGHQITIIPEDLARRTVTVAAHNEYIRLCVELGYLGCAAAFTIITAMLLDVWYDSGKPKDLAFPAACLSFLVFCYSDNALSVPEIFLILTAAAFSVTTPQAHVIAIQRRRAIELA